MALPEQLVDPLAAFLNSEIRQARRLTGGDIHQAFHLDTAKGPFFVKTNTIAQALAMFKSEAKGLDLLDQTRTLSIPKRLGVGQAGAYAFLILEFIPSGRPNSTSTERLGRGLARMHRASHSTFGLDHPNFIGPLPQSNQQYPAFANFYFQERLWPQFQLASGKGLMTAADGEQLEALGKLLPSLIPEEPPALIHGDLWNGNYLIGPEGVPYLIDPAVAFSHREADLALTRLFGGFDQDFYDAYQEEYPVHAGWEERLPIFQLYYLLVHLNVFGRSYYPAVKGAIRV